MQPQTGSTPTSTGRGQRRRRWATVGLAVGIGLTGLVAGGSPAAADIGDGQCDGPNPPPACDFGPEPTTPGPVEPAPSTPVPPTLPPPPSVPPSTIVVPASNGRTDAYIPAGAQPKVAVPMTDGAFLSGTAVASRWPFSPLVELRWDPPGPNNASSCSGFLIGPRTVATAAHCVWRNGSYKGGGTADGVGIASVWAPYEYRHFANDDGSETPFESRMDYAAVTLTGDLGYLKGWMALEPHPNIEPGGPIMLLSTWQGCKGASGMPGLWFATRGAGGSYNIEIGGNSPSGCSGGPIVNSVGGAAIGITSSSDSSSTTAHHLRQQSVDDLMAVRNGMPRPDPAPSQGGGGGGGSGCRPQPSNNYCTGTPIVVLPPGGTI